jgi:tetratricopeptide (TPR) repeat protein
MNSRSALVCVLAFLVAVVPARAQFKLEASLGDLEARARRDSNDAAAHYNVALGYWNAKRFDDSEKAFRVAIALDPRFAAPYMGLAFLPYARRPRLREEVSDNRVPEEWKSKVDEAATMLRRAYLIDPFVEVRLGGAIRPTSWWSWKSSLANTCATTLMRSITCLPARIRRRTTDSSASTTTLMATGTRIGCSAIWFGFTASQPDE